jgi:hypothetical protein
MGSQEQPTHPDSVLVLVLEVALSVYFGRLLAECAYERYDPESGNGKTRDQQEGT